ncbi:hypothetical protein Nepgr_015040 [Nepenthes gracilis]|uniref:Uncharacterized protein n=1 Tax=Nepenthes gracilis TaxID=150966 RepID=A0AAD3XQS1_NEPGR|nr:hypothetical protein Nepgr_015040 [Nepenthes gracilis]
MHVSPDGLWPHTKLLEDFINGGEAASLLDCIRLTAGPLNALATSMRPARAGQAAVIPGVIASMSALSKQSTYLSSQGPLHNSSTTNAGQTILNHAGNSVSSTVAGDIGNHGLHGSAVSSTAFGPGWLWHCSQLTFSN